jgi:hypothetical protein
MAIRAPVVFLIRKDGGCFSVHEVLDEEQEEKAFRIRGAPLRKA